MQWEIGLRIFLFEGHVFFFVRPINGRLEEIRIQNEDWKSFPAAVLVTADQISLKERGC